MNNKMVMNGDRTKVSYYFGAEEQQGISMANKRTHKRYLRQHRLGKFRKGRAE